MKITTAPFDALYELPPAVPSSPSTLAIVTTLPRSPSIGSCSSMLRDRVLAHEERAGEVDVEHALPLVAVDRCAGPPPATPAAVTTASIRPCSATTVATHVGDRRLVAHVEASNGPATSTPHDTRPRRER